MPNRRKKQSAKAPAKPKRLSGSNRKPAHRLITEHMGRMAEGPMPDDFGTQLSTFMAHIGRKGGKVTRRSKKP